MSSFDIKNDLTWRDFLIRAAHIIGTVTIIAWLMPRSNEFSFNVEKGRPWVYSDLSAPFDFPIYKSDEVISKEPDGSFNEDFCKWCYADGKFAYKTKDSLLDYLVGHMPNPDNTPDDERRAQFDGYLSQLKHWK